MFGGVYVSVEQPSAPPLCASWREIAGRELGVVRFRRFVIHTHLIVPRERLERTLDPYLRGMVQPGDTLAISEKAVAIAEGRLVLLRSVRARRLAVFLARRVRDRGYGMGFRRPETMEMAIHEAGPVRILLAAAAAALTRPCGRSGDFYRVAGRRVAAIDGPTAHTIPPYDRYIVLAPVRGGRLCRRLARRLGIKVAVVDVNDVGSEVLEASAGVDRAAVKRLLDDNPMGQGAGATPLVVLRADSRQTASRDQYNGDAGGARRQ